MKNLENKAQVVFLVAVLVGTLMLIGNLASHSNDAKEGIKEHLSGVK